jgi:hypothetical protein
MVLNRRISDDEEANYHSIIETLGLGRIENASFGRLSSGGESGPNQHPIPEQASTPFRWKPAPYSGPNQQVIPEQASRFS